MHNSRRAVLAFAVALVLGVSPAAMAGGPADGHDGNGNDGNGNGNAGKTTICHATGSEGNPYVEITVSNNALDAHARHQDGRDIIPAPEEGCPTGDKGDDCEKGDDCGKHDHCKKGRDGKKKKHRGGKKHDGGKKHHGGGKHDH